MSEPLDPAVAGVASLLKSLRTRAGLRADRLAGTELPLDPLTGLDRVQAFVAAGDTPEQAIVQAVGDAASSLEPTLSIVADVCLCLELSADVLPAVPELYAPDLGRRREALLANWDRLHELRSVDPPGPAPSPRALRLVVETGALAALATALTEPAGQEATEPREPASQLTGTGMVPGERTPALSAAEKRVFGMELGKALRSRRRTIEGAASALSLAPAEIARWEAGEDLPSGEKARALDDYLTARGAVYALAEELRARATRATHGSAPPRLHAASTPTLLQAFDGIAHAVRESLIRDENGTPVGWPRDLRQLGAPASPLSTAYGIRLMLLLEGSLAPDLVPVAERLRERAASGGGFTAQGQLAPRPEVTAAVLEAVHRIDGTASFGAQLAAMKDDLDDFEKSRPFILTSMLEASRQLAPGSELTASLVNDLLAARRPYGDLLLWPEKAEPLLVAPAPSIAHTARAVRALAQIQALRPLPQVQDALEQAAAWLAAQHDLANTSEIIDRMVGGSLEQIYNRHFTAAWVTKALISVGLPTSHPSVSAAVAWIWGSYSDTAALWSWDNGDLPIWLTFDAVDALRLASLAGTIRPGRYLGQ